jgi:predicted metal-dependent hydrolase
MPERTPAPKPNRTRRSDAPPKRERPRDELGRPLPWGTPSRLEMEDFDAMSAEESHRAAIRLFEERRFFPAHEAWEAAWRASKGGEDEEFFKGLSQLGAGYVHHLRGNPHGTFTLLRRAGTRIGRYPSPHRGVDTARLSRIALAQADEVERAFRAGRALGDVAAPEVVGPDGSDGSDGSSGSGGA